MSSASEPKKTFNNSHFDQINEEPGDEPVDDIEKAIFDLQDVKNCYQNEQRDFEDKLEAAKTQEGFWKSKKPQENNFF